MAVTDIAKRRWILGFLLALSLLPVSILGSALVSGKVLSAVQADVLNSLLRIFAFCLGMLFLRQRFQTPVSTSELVRFQVVFAILAYGSATSWYGWIDATLPPPQSLV